MNNFASMESGRGSHSPDTQTSEGASKKIPGSKIYEQFSNKPESVVHIAEKMRLSIEERRPQLDEFINVPGYSKAKIENDKRRVQEHVALFRQNADTSHSPEEARALKQISDIVEGMIIQMTSKWFGESLQAYPTSEIDDYIKGVDTILERIDKNGIRHVALSLDLTFSSDVRVLNTKFSKVIEKDILKGEGSSAEYVKTSSYVGPLKNLPRAIIVVDRKVVSDFILNENMNNQQRTETHPFRLVLLEQLFQQFDFFAKIAENEGNDVMLEQYEKSLDLIGEMMDELKVEFNKNGQYLDNSPGLNAVLGFIEESESRGQYF